MTNDQKIVATGAATGVVTMLALLAGLSAIMPGIAADAAAGDRLAFAVKWIALGALPLALMIASVGNERFGSAAIDPTAGKESPAMVVNGRACGNTMQQYLLFITASLALTASLSGERMGVISAAAITFLIARFTFWVGYRIRPLYRAAGFSSTFYLNVVLFGYALWLAWFA